jgi:zinc transporter, ZIP family
MPDQPTAGRRPPVNWRAVGTAIPRPGRVAGVFIALAALALLSREAWQAIVFHDPRVGQAFLGGLMAAGATALGTVPMLVSRPLSDRVQDTLLGFGAGVMLAACAFSLIIPGLEAAEATGAGPWESGSIVGGGILLGAALLLVIDYVLPHEHFIKGVEGRTHAIALRRAWLFVFAICLHNLPEGLAIGVAFGGSDAARATALTTGIAIQDVPEGLVVALALRTAGYGRLLSAGLGMASGLIEPIGAVLGAAVVSVSSVLLPWGLAFAAGAMLFVVSHEIIPESHRKGHERFATGGLMVGFVLMMMLDTSLG